MHVSHGQWTFRNFTLHSQQRGGPTLQNRAEVLEEIERLLDVEPEQLPAESRFLLEFDHSAMGRLSFARQSYWVRAMRAARWAGRRTALQHRRAGGGHHRRQARLPQGRTRVVDTRAVQRRIDEEMGLATRPTRKRPHPAAIEAANPVNKRLQHPD